MTSKFILDLFVQELEMLHAGFQVTISDHQDYFVQARAISHVNNGTLIPATAIHHIVVLILFSECTYSVCIQWK